MNTRSYELISGTLFALVATAHLLRVLSGWEVVAGPWNFPMWLSWVGTIVPAALSVWAFRLASR
jgi:acyl-CoA reductase-like NAD-dependent aldehyde dehydrogenase